jgi:signal transduction histidine kinase
MYTVSISLTDQGIGISKENQKQLFQPFFRVRNEENKSFNPNGNGLGLSICKQIAKCLGGDILVDSTVGVGSCFNFEFKT